MRFSTFAILMFLLSLTLFVIEAQRDNHARLKAIETRLGIDWQDRIQ